MKFAVLIGRILFSLIFIQAIIVHFSQEGTEYAANGGVPLASVIVPFSGIIALLGGLSIAFGYKAKVGAWLIVIFLVPVTLMMHNFWAVTDAQAAQMQMGIFLKNLSMLGGALLIAYFGAGPLSFDARKEIPFRRTQRVSERIKTPKVSRIPEEKSISRTKEKADKQGE
jgi:putative oxidoreductase